MSKSVWCAAACALALLAVGTASAQDAQTTTDDETVVVVGRPDVVRSFVGEITTTSVGSNQIARWGAGVCPRVVGLRSDWGRQIVDRVSQRAAQLSLSVGGPGCRWNIIVAVTPEADRIAREVVENNRGELGYYSERGQRTMGRDALAEFQASDAPVRWWRVNHLATEDGMGLNGGTMQVRDASRLRSTTREDFRFVLIVVDQTQIEGVELNALADYLAMVSLAQVDPTANTADAPSILNLCHPAAGATPSEMTDWDFAFLQGLYEANQYASSETRQVNDIARRMLEADGVAEDPPASAH